MEGASTYTISSVSFQYMTSSNPTPRMEIALATDSKLPLVRKNPRVFHVKDDRISDITNTTFSTTINSGKFLIQYRFIKAARLDRLIGDNGESLYGAIGYMPMLGMYLVYNPTNHSDNIGYEVSLDGTTQVDFETLQKYAPWRIYPPET